MSKIQLALSQTTSLIGALSNTQQCNRYQIINVKKPDLSKLKCLFPWSNTNPKVQKFNTHANVICIVNYAAFCIYLVNKVSRYLGAKATKDDSLPRQ